MAGIIETQMGEPVTKPTEQLHPAIEKQTLVAIADSQWCIGQTMFLQQENARYAVRLIGFTEGKSILVSALTKEGKYQIVREGQVFVVRTFAGKKAYAFTASVLKAGHAPYPYLHLSYPAQVSCAIVRRGSRVETNLVAAVSLPNADQTSAMMIQDISMGGAAGNIREPVGVPGESFRLRVKLTVAGDDIFLDLPVTLRSVQPDEGTTGYRHGFEFGALEMRDKLALGAFLHETRFEKD